MCILVYECPNEYAYILVRVQLYDHVSAYVSACTHYFIDKVSMYSYLCHVCEYLDMCNCFCVDEYTYTFTFM